ncbi:MAG: UDP-N-acetylmuramate dehydrogenase [Planctomycetes bacterium]|nr:UDP-N-acetylmuramate dehydrogenase [Planctomycetota bacterium]
MREVEYGVPARALTSMGVGGPVDRLYRPAAPGDALKIIDRARAEGEKPLFLGGGSNLLVGDAGLRRPVISTARLRDCRLLPDGRIRAEAGVPLPKLVARAAAWGLSGLEGLAGIPGSVGGAVFMNAGGGGTSAGDAVESVEVAVPGRGLETLARGRIRFEYRRTSLRGVLILAATFRLAPADPEAIRDRIRRVMERKRATQPQRARSAGCFFKNPGKVPAGLLIDRAGCKGMRVGGAIVSDVHGNFLVNLGGATAEDVMRLATQVRDVVRASCGVSLRMEVKYWTSGARTAVRVGAAAERVAERVLA